MSSFTVVAKATNATEFEELSISKIFVKNWRKQFQPLMVKVLEANLFDCKYPEVQLELKVEANVVIELVVSNIETDDRMKLLWPKLAEDGELEFVNLSYCLHVSEGHEWTLNFVEGCFSAGSAEFKNYVSNRDGLEIEGWFTNIDALDKQKLIRLMLNKMDVFFTYQSTFSPERLMNVLCQALDAKQEDFHRLTVSMGFCNVLKVKDGEITEAVELGKDYTIRLDSKKHATYKEGKFSLCEESNYQRYKVEYENYFTSDLLYLAEHDIKSKISETKKKIINFLHEIALCNEKMK